MKIYLAAFLAIASLELLNVYIVRGSIGSQIMARSFCFDVKTPQISIKNISQYEIKDIPEKIVIFITRRGVKICMPHNHPWTQKTIQTLNKRNKKKTKRQEARTITTLRPRPATS